MPDKPRFVFAYAEMAQVAEDVRKNRAEGDPALVDAGKLSPEDATSRLRISTAIAVDWKAYARMELPPLDLATDVEKIIDLKAVLTGAEKRRDHARTAMMHEYGAAIGDLSLGELWAIHDSHDTRSLRIWKGRHQGSRSSTDSGRS